MLQGVPASGLKLAMSPLQHSPLTQVPPSQSAQGSEVSPPFVPPLPFVPPAPFMPASGGAADRRDSPQPPSVTASVASKLGKLRSLIMSVGPRAASVARPSLPMPRRSYPPNEQS